MSPRRGTSKPFASIEDRLRLHSVVAPSGCWIWLGGQNGRGYGALTVYGKRHYVHRLSYETFVGPIPDGYQVDHLCRKRNCIRPEHLQAVTPQTNIRRGTSPGARALRRTHCLQGHAYAEHAFMERGRRLCRVCRVERQRTYTAKRRAARAAA